MNVCVRPRACLWNAGRVMRSYTLQPLSVPTTTRPRATRLQSIGSMSRTRLGGSQGLIRTPCRPAAGRWRCRCALIGSAAGSCWPTAALPLMCGAQCKYTDLKVTPTGVSLLQVELMDELQSAETLQDEMQQLAERYAHMVRACCEHLTCFWLQSNASFQDLRPQHNDESQAA